jgi:hypothetical protein
LQCGQFNQRLPEGEYPPTFNPSKKLQVVAAQLSHTGSQQSMPNDGICQRSRSSTPENWTPGQTAFKRRLLVFDSMNRFNVPNLGKNSEEIGSSDLQEPASFHQDEQEGDLAITSGTPHAQLVEGSSKAEEPQQLNHDLEEVNESLRIALQDVLHQLQTGQEDIPRYASFRTSESKESSTSLTPEPTGPQSTPHERPNMLMCIADDSPMPGTSKLESYVRYDDIDSDRSKKRMVQSVLKLSDSQTKIAEVPSDPMSGTPRSSVQNNSVETNAEVHIISSSGPALIPNIDPPRNLPSTFKSDPINETVLTQHLENNGKDVQDQSDANQIAMPLSPSKQNTRSKMVSPPLETLPVPPSAPSYVVSLSGFSFEARERYGKNKYLPDLFLLILYLNSVIVHLFPNPIWIISRSFHWLYLFKLWVGIMLLIQSKVQVLWLLQPT